MRGSARTGAPEQIAGWCARHRLLAISHETIDRHVWQDKANGGALYTHLRGARKQLRKRYGAYASRGRLAGKRPIATRPVGAANRSRYGHWERDTVLGDSQGGACILTLVERKSGYTVIAKIDTPQRALRRCTREAAHRTSTTPDAHDHGRQRHRVSRGQTARSAGLGAVLLRHAASRVGTRHQQKNKRIDLPILTEAHAHGAPSAGRLHPHRHEA